MITKYLSKPFNLSRSSSSSNLSECFIEVDLATCALLTMYNHVFARRLLSIENLSLVNLKRRMRKSCVLLEDDSPIPNSSSTKITVVKRKMSENKDVLFPIEWKEASSVMKRLNWENKCLFGPIQHEKQPSNQKYERSLDNLLIQHQTQIPIIDPSDQNVECFESKTDVNSNDRKTIDFQALTSFPLVNDKRDKSYSESYIYRFNVLRKRLEDVCERDSKIPSVTSILEKTMPKDRVMVLNRWKQNMIQQLGEEGFKVYQKELFDKGSNFHDMINSYLTSTPVAELEIKTENKGHWESLQHVFPDIKDVKLLEESVIHPFLCYKGIIDCFAIYKSQLVVIDWKTSKKSKKNIRSTYDNPLQIAAYVGALNFDPKYQYLAKQGLIIIAYEDGSPATTHFIDGRTMKYYWDQWILRVKLFWQMKLSETT